MKLWGALWIKPKPQITPRWVSSWLFAESTILQNDPQHTSFWRMDFCGEGGWFWLGPDLGKDGAFLLPSGCVGNDKGSKSTPQVALARTLQVRHPSFPFPSKTLKGGGRERDWISRKYICNMCTSSWKAQVMRTRRKLPGPSTVSDTEVQRLSRHIPGSRRSIKWREKRLKLWIWKVYMRCHRSVFRRPWEQRGRLSTLQDGETTKWEANLSTNP